MEDPYNHLNLMVKFALIIVIIVIFTVLSMAPFSSAVAQEARNNLVTLFNDLHSRMQEEGVLISITLHTPLAQDQQRITIGYSHEDINVSIYSIGEDYLCLREIQGAAEIISCIPYNNIAGVDYINN